MRDVLVAVEHDYHLSPTERASLRSATATIPDRPEMRDLDLAPTELHDCVLSVLAVCAAYRDALQAR